MRTFSPLGIPIGTNLVVLGLMNEMDIQLDHSGQSNGRKTFRRATLSLNLHRGPMSHRVESRIDAVYYESK